jgi:hypothetical protein
MLTILLRKQITHWKAIIGEIQKHPNHFILVKKQEVKTAEVILNGSLIR